MRQTKFTEYYLDTNIKVLVKKWIFIFNYYEILDSNHLSLRIFVTPDLTSPLRFF